jgi:hypothetical protein
MSRDLASPKFDLYREKFIFRDADLTRMQYEDEIADVCSNADVFSVTIAPMDCYEIGQPPKVPRSSGSNMHLWLVRRDDVVTVLEKGASGLSTQRQRLAHTNLCGSDAAHCGGELWFRDGSSIWLTGGSSRFPPRNQEELGAIVDTFRVCGYSVCSCGWDEENDQPARFFRGKETWLEHDE